MPLHRLTYAAHADEASLTHFPFLICQLSLFAHQTAGAMPLLRLTYAAHADEASLTHLASPILLPVDFVFLLLARHSLWQHNSALAAFVGSEVVSKVTDTTPLFLKKLKGGVPVTFDTTPSFYVTFVSMIQNGRNDESEPFINNSNAITKERKAWSWQRCKYYNYANILWFMVHK